MAGPFTVVIAPEAAVEIAHIMEWWRHARPSASSLFRIELEQALLKLVEYPAIGARARLKNTPDVRYIVLRRTGYLVFYDVNTAASEIEVLRVRHSKRRPLVRLKRK